MYRGVLALVAVVVFAGCIGLAPADVSAPDGPDNEERPAPDEDELGYHDGYWYDDPIAVNTTNGLNESERDVLAARSIARVEHLRGLEFDKDVNITVINRTQFSGEARNWTVADDQQTFEDAKFAALFMVGTGESASESQQENTGNVVSGFYSPSTEAIVIVSDRERPRVDTTVLIHELTHAAQDQHFDLNATTARYPHDRNQARLGLIEGDANLVQQEYEARCGTEWSCVQYGDGDGGDSQPPEPHWGLYFTSFFPYSDGPTFTQTLRDGDDWSGVNDAFGQPPNSTVEIMNPELYGEFEPEPVTISDAGEWNRVRRDGAPDYDELGPSALAASFAYTLYDDSNPDALITPNDFLNLNDGEVNETDPLNYELAQTQGWRGDRLHVYEQDGEMAYVWRLNWESSAAADRFTEDYHELLGYWGGQRVEGDIWEIGDNSPFTGAYRVTTVDETVTITYAPSQPELTEVRDPAADRPGVEADGTSGDGATATATVVGG